MGGALLVPLALPYINTSEVRSSAFRPLYRQFYWLFVVDCLILGWIGQKPVEYPFIEVGQVGTFYYFFFLLAIIPMAGLVEARRMRTNVGEESTGNWALKPKRSRYSTAAFQEKVERVNQNFFERLNAKVPQGHWMRNYM